MAEIWVRTYLLLLSLCVFRQVSSGHGVWVPLQGSLAKTVPWPSLGDSGVYLLLEVSGIHMEQVWWAVTSSVVEAVIVLMMMVEVHGFHPFTPQATQGN